jgi:hypothetical protein
MLKYCGLGTRSANKSRRLPSQLNSSRAGLAQTSGMNAIAGRQAAPALVSRILSGSKAKDLSWGTTVHLVHLPVNVRTRILYQRLRGKN